MNIYVPLWRTKITSPNNQGVLLLRLPVEISSGNNWSILNRKEILRLDFYSNFAILAEILVSNSKPSDEFSWLLVFINNRDWKLIKVKCIFLDIKKETYKVLEKRVEKLRQ